MPRHTLPDGTTLNYDLWGLRHKPRVLVLVGLGNTINSLMFLQRELIRHFHCLVFEHRGTGSSSGPDPSWPTPTMEVFANDAWQLVQAMGWQSCSVMGLSFGGLVAQEFMLAHSAFVDKVLLVCAGPGYKGEDEMHRTQDMPAEQRLKTFLMVSDTRRDEDWFESEGGRMAMELMRRNANTGSDAGRRYQMAARADFSLARRLGLPAEAPAKPPPTATNGGGSTQQAEERQLLSKEEEEASRLTPADTAGAQLGPRTLCLWAVYDGLADINVVVDLQKLLPGASLCLFDSAHWPILAQEDPESFNATVVSWLEGRGVPPEVAERSDNLASEWLPGASICSQCAVL